LELKAVSGPLYQPQFIEERIGRRNPLVSILKQPNPVHILIYLSLKPILILSSHLRVGFPIGLIPSGLLTKI
jgi:hypothetical protein